MLLVVGEREELWEAEGVEEGQALAVAVREVSCEEEGKGLCVEESEAVMQEEVV